MTYPNLQGVREPCIFLPLMFVKKFPVIVGHRGARGEFPENSLLGIIETLKNATNHVEMDIVVSKDRKLLLSHEPWFSFLTCAHPDGSPVKMGSQGNLFHMDYSLIRQYDCGSRRIKNFPLQKKITSSKPLLAEILENGEAVKTCNDEKPVYYLELKSRPERYKKFQPGPDEFADLFIETVKSFSLAERAVIKSFDPLLLSKIKQRSSEYQFHYLCEKPITPSTAIRHLGFLPEAISPNHKFLNEKNVAAIKSSGLQMFTWTTNSKSEILKALKLGADGIITDFPLKTMDYIRSRK